MRGGEAKWPLLAIDEIEPRWGTDVTDVTDVTGVTDVTEIEPRWGTRGALQTLHWAGVELGVHRSRRLHRGGPRGLHRGGLSVRARRRLALQEIEDTECVLLRGAKILALRRRRRLHRHRLRR